MAVGVGVELVRRAEYDIAMQERLREADLQIGALAIAHFELPQNLTDSVLGAVRIEGFCDEYHGTTVELELLDKDLYPAAAISGLMRYGVFRDVSPPDILAVTRLNAPTLLPGKGCLVAYGDGLGGCEQKNLRTRMLGISPNIARYMKPVRLPD